MNGAHIVRVHDVANTLATVKIVDALMNVQDGEGMELRTEGRLQETQGQATEVGGQRAAGQKTEGR